MKKKGFTLVELLAVIVILAIIALITVPIVLKTISNSEVQSEKQSIDGYARVIEDDKSNFEMTHPGQQYQIKPDEDYDYKGNRVFCQERYFDSNNHDKLVLKNCYVSETKLSDEEASKKNHYNYINGKVELIKNSDNSTNNNQGNNTNNNKIYEIGEEVTLKNEKYNVIGVGSDYVTLLKQQPLTVDEVNTYGGVGTENNHVNKYTSSNVGLAFEYSDTNHTGGMAYYSSPECGLATPDSLWKTGGCESEGATNYNNSDVKYVVDAWASAKFPNELKTVDGYSARLVQKEELRTQFYPSCSPIASNCVKESTTPSWLYAPNYEYSYWTMSQWNSSSVYLAIVNYNGDLGNDGNVDSCSIAVRPVINIYKSKL